MKKVLCVFLILSLMCAAAAGCGKKNNESESVGIISEITASKTVGTEIAADSALVVKTYGPQDEDAVKNALSISPAANYSLKKLGGSTYQLNFESELKPDTVYTASSVQSGRTVYSWAFQTAHDFKVNYTSPGRGAYAAPDCKISVEFSYKNVENFDKNFEITPFVSGKTSVSGNTATFTPDEPLKDGETYNVKIKSGVSAPTGAKLGDDYTFCFEVHENVLNYAKIITDGEDPADSFLSEEIPEVGITAAGLTNMTADVSVYSFKNHSDYLSAHKQYFAPGNYYLASELISSLKSVQNFKAEVKDETLHYPNTLESGYYLSVIKMQDYTLYHVFQVSDFAVYSIKSGSNLNVWVNDVKNGSALIGSEVLLDDSYTQKTDGNGIAAFTLSENEPEGRYIIVIGEGKTNPYIEYVKTADSNKYDAAKNYSARVYASKTENGGVKIEGNIAAAKNTELKASAEIYLSWCDKTVTAEIDKNGAFSVECDVAPRTVKGAYADLYVDGLKLYTASLAESDFSAKKYSAEAVAEKNAVFADEQDAVSVYAEENGIAAADTEVVINGETVKTGADGKAICNYTKKADKNEFSAVTLTPSIKGKSDGETERGESNIIVFSRRITVDGTYKNGVLSVKSNEISTDALNAMTPSEITQLVKYNKITRDLYAGRATYQKIVAEAHEVETVKSLDNTGYKEGDAGVSKKNGRYEIDRVIATETGYTVNGEASFNFNLAADAKTAYYFNLKYTDGENESVTRVDVKSANVTADTSGGEYRLDIKSKSGSVEDSSPMSAVLFKGDKTVSDGVVMLTLCQSGIIGSRGYGTAFDFTYPTDCGSAVYASAAYFDGKHIYNVPRQIIKADADKYKLKTVIVPESNSVTAGGEAAFAVTTADANGNAVSAEVDVIVSRGDISPRGNISGKRYTLYAPDEQSLGSAFSTGESKSDEPVYTAGGAAELPQAFIRKTVTTDKNGKATVKIKMPDAVGSWTVAADSSYLGEKNGFSKTKIKTSKIFYAAADVPSEIKCGEKLKFSASAVDTVGKDTSECTLSAAVYAVGISGENAESAVLIKTVSANQPTEFEFDGLAAGKYSYTVTLNRGEQSDSLSGRFTVSADGGFTVSKADQSNKIAAEANSEVTALIFDGSAQTVYNAAKHISEADGGIEGRLAEIMLGQMIFGGGYSDDLKKYQSDGTLMTNDTVALTALCTAAAPDLFDKSALKKYFYDAAEKSGADSYAAYLGLAALGEPILTDLTYMYMHRSDLSDESRLYLALSFACIGDFTTAESIYKNSLAEKIAPRDGGSVFIRDNDEDTRRHSALMSMLASKLNTDEAEPLVKYILKNSDSESIHAPLCLWTYIGCYAPNISGDKLEVTLTADEYEKQICFDKFAFAKITVPKCQLEKLSISSRDKLMIIYAEQV